MKDRVDEKTHLKLAVLEVDPDFGK
jgi:hypothetical protein